jgi:DNA invertase Pin-like site-specific DNA recombinase
MGTATLSQKAPFIPTLGNAQLSASPQKIAVSPRYCLYARKSSEEDERQALSIDSQVKEMLAVAKREGLEIVEIRRESHSAKASGARPVFKQLLEDIRRGGFTGILTWAPDRLSRNAGDLGSVVDLMDQGFLIDIRTHGQRFTNNPNEKFLLMILCSQAKLENDNRGLNVKRGQKTRVEMGYRPCLVPLGYLLEKQSGLARGKVIIDPIRGPIIRQMFEHVAHQGASGRVLQQWLKEVNFTTRKGKRITLSMIYRMLRQHYYTGKFEYPQDSGNFYKGDYEPLVSQDLFNEVQKLLSMGPKREWGSKTDNFHFTRMLLCGGCGSGITAEEKQKPLKDGSIKKYIYYRCTHSRDLRCKEPSIREEELIEQLSAIIDSIDLDELGMRMKLEEEVSRYKKFTNGVFGKESAPEMLGVDVRRYAKYILREGTKDEKHELLSCLKSKLILKDGSIRLEDKRKRR